MPTQHVWTREIVVELDMAYLGQTHTVAVPISAVVAGGQVVPPTRQQIAEAFDAAYLATYGRLLNNGVRRVINMRTAVIGRRPKFDLATLAPESGTLEAALKGQRQVHFATQWYDTAIYDRLAPLAGLLSKAPPFWNKPTRPFLSIPDWWRVWMTTATPLSNAKED
ncbi:MAG: hypothetical protein R3D81_17190 [Thalassovita sp.]